MHTWLCIPRPIRSWFCVEYSCLNVIYLNLELCSSSNDHLHHRIPTPENQVYKCQHHEECAVVSGSPRVHFLHLNYGCSRLCRGSHAVRPFNDYHSHRLLSRRSIPRQCERRWYYPHIFYELVEANKAFYRRLPGVGPDLASDLLKYHHLRVQKRRRADVLL